MGSDKGRLSSWLWPHRGNWKIIMAGAVALALVIEIALLHPTLAAADKTLTDAQIAETNKPGTVMIWTGWTSTINFRESSLPREKLQALAAFAQKQAELGLIQKTAPAINKAMLEELVRHPLEYLVGGETSKTMNVHTAATGSGFIVTPDGYIVTNAHVVYSDDDELRDTIVKYWSHNEMKDIVIKDAQKFAELFHRAVGIPISDEMINEFVGADLAYYKRNIRFNNNVVQVFALMGVAIPGLPTQPKGIPCDVRKPIGDPVGTGSSKDVAICKIEQSNLPTVLVGDDTALSTGDHIVVLGYPGAAELPSQPTGVESTLTQGDLSARKTMPGGWSALQTSAEINHGNSGGPAFNDKGEVIGIATFGPEARGINFLVPMSVAKQFLDEHNIKPQQSRLSQLYQEGIAQFRKQCYKGALEKFKEVGDLSPGFPFVQDKITKSRVAIDQGLDRCWMPGPTYIGAAVAALLIVLTAVWFLMRRRAVPAVVAPAPVTRSVEAQAERALPGVPVGGGAVALPARSFGSLQCTAGPVTGRRFEITRQGLLIGRDPSRCQIVLSDDAVSKEHAWVVALDEGVFVIDRGSTNGTFVNSVDSPKVSKVRLQPGDRIYIGKGVATFTYQSS